MGRVSALALLGVLALAAPASQAATPCPSPFATSNCMTYTVYSGENILAPSGGDDTTAINNAINTDITGKLWSPNKPDATVSVVRFGTGQFGINVNQMQLWPNTTVEGKYLSAADGTNIGTPGGTVLQAIGSWAPPPPPNIPTTGQVYEISDGHGNYLDIGSGLGPVVSLYAGSGNSNERFTWNGTTLVNGSNGLHDNGTGGLTVVALASADAFAFGSVSGGYTIQDTTSGHYMEIGSASTCGGYACVTVPMGATASTWTIAGPAALTQALTWTTDRVTLRNLTFRGIGGTAPDCVWIINSVSIAFENVDAVNCHNNWNALAQATGTSCNNYPWQHCYTQLIHWFLGNSIGATNYGIAIGGAGLDSAFSSDSFMYGTNIYGSAGGNIFASNNAAGGVAMSLAEISGGGIGIENDANSPFSFVGNSVEGMSLPVKIAQAGMVLVGNYIGNSGTGPMIDIVNGNYNFPFPIAGNIYFGGGCVYTSLQPVTAAAFYDAPNIAASTCDSTSATNTAGARVIPTAAFP